LKELEQRESNLLDELNQLEELRNGYDNFINEHNNLKGENAVFIEKLKNY